MEINYYSILELDKNSSDADIKKQYRKLAMKWHPDKNANKEEASLRFQEIGEAYDVLSDPQKRAIYDQYGYEGLHDGIEASDDYKTGYQFKQNAQDIFESFFGTSNPFAAFGFAETMPFAAKLNKPGPKKSPAVEMPLECTLAELFNGCVKKFAATRIRKNAEGDYVEATKVLVIHIKPGWKKGVRVTFPAEGDEGPGTLPGDIVFVISEVPSPAYSRQGDNLIYLYIISLADALSDCALQIPTLDGRTISIACPEVVSPYTEKLVEGEGMPKMNDKGSRGDLIIHFHIQFPKYLNGKKKLQMRELLAGEELQA